MKQYHDMLQYILDNGLIREDRTGTGTVSVFGYQNRYNLQEGFPLVGTKKMPPRIIFEELRWFLNGDTNIKYLLEKKVNIWNADAYRDYKENGGYLSYDDFINKIAKEQGYDLGPIYGKQWRSWDCYLEDGTGYAEKLETIDQIKQAIKLIKNNPKSRRIIVTAWNPSEVDDMALPPCHCLFQYYVREGKYLDCQLYQRSADAFLGVPFNIASYAFKIHMMAQVCGLEAGEFIHTFGDLHIYKNHIQQVLKQLKREIKPLPTLLIDPSVKNIEDFEWEHFELIGYNPDGPIKGDVSVG